MSELKLYCIVSKEAVQESKGNRGKMGAQIGHAYTEAVFDALDRFPDVVKAYRDSGIVAKVCLVADEETLHKLSRLYKDKYGVALIKDAGKTVFPRPMITALGIGPIDPKDREDILKGLKPWI
jgi:peptidyl-tRNA hydrolase